MPKIVLFNVSWMMHYQGRTRTDKPLNGGKYVIQANKTNSHIGEIWNFKDHSGRLYGYVRNTNGSDLNLARIDRSEKTNERDYIDGTTVVFVAKRPSGGRVVVGWYKNARVWRTQQQSPHSREWPYICEAKLSDCRLLSPDCRAFSVPSAKKGEWGMGQCNVRYLDQNNSRNFRVKLLDYINKSNQPNPFSHRTNINNSRSGRQNDPVIRVQVEEAAVSLVLQHYSDDLGYKCVSVEKENIGWDIEAVNNDTKLLIEVKGCSGRNPDIIVTPNEYKKMMQQSHRDHYRLAIVTNALSHTKKLFIVAYNRASKSWCDQNGNRANIKELTAARISL